MQIGNFTIEANGITGPKEYLDSESYRETMRKIENGTHVLLGYNTGNVYAAIGVILQTDYAAFLGMKRTIAQMEAAKA